MGLARGSRFVVPILAVGVVVAALLLLGRGAEDDSRTDAVSGEGTTEPAEAARLAGRSAPEVVPAESAPDEAAEAAAEDASARVELCGEVVIEDTEAAVEIRAFPSSSVVVVGGRTGPGPFRLDVTALVRSLDLPGDRPEIVITAEAPGHVGPTVHVALPSPEDLLAGRATLDAVTLVLERAAVVYGQVVGSDGAPIHGAGVALFRLTAGEPEEEAVSCSLSGAEGVFSLATARTGRYLLVASHRVTDLDTGAVTERLLPASLVVDLVVGQSVEGLLLRLAASFAIRGRVQVDGKPAEGARVSWRLAGEARVLRDPSFLGTGSTLRYLEGTVHWSGDPVTTDAHGRFEILGASAVPYRVGVDEVVGAHLHRMSKEGHEVEVTPPTADVVLDLRLARLVLLVRADGKPARLEEPVQVADYGMHPEYGDEIWWGTWQGETDEEGRLEVHLTPGGRYAVDLDEPGFEPWWKELVAPAAGETLTLTADLVPERPRPRLVVTLEGDGAERIGRAAFGFYEPDVDPLSRTPWPLRSAENVDGRYVLEDLVPGRFRLHVRPGREWFGLPAGWLEAVVDVEIPAAGEAEVAVPVRTGGRLLIEAVDADGRHLECPCTIRDPEGDVLPTYFVVATEVDGRVISHRLPGLGPAWVNRVLVPGAYEVTLEPEGYRREVREVEIRAGAPTTLRVVLEPR